MTKKSRRTRAKYQGRAASPTGARPAREPRAMPSESATPARVMSRVQDPASRYQHVMPELKRIGIIAGAMIVVLIILSFILG